MSYYNYCSHTLTYTMCIGFQLFSLKTYTKLLSYGCKTINNVYFNTVNMKHISKVRCL